MNPAWSVILFTTVCGGAQGLVVALALARLAGVAVAPLFVERSLGLALAMLVFGLMASFFHLGRPERAWRAVRMWRTSWLSREVIVLPAFIAAVAAWWWWGQAAPAALLLLCLGLSALLWWCTAMIYACLRFIQEWAHPLTHAGFALIGLSSGLVLAGALARAADEPHLAAALAPWALATTLAAWGIRLLARRRNATLKAKSTLQSATGIHAPRLVQTSMGMSAGAFNTREFFHQATQAALRRVTLLGPLLAFILPVMMLIWAQRTDSGVPWALALLLQAPGLLAERWLFFAQARHPQNLYYQVVS